MNHFKTFTLLSSTVLSAILASAALASDESAISTSSRRLGADLEPTRHALSLEYGLVQSVDSNEKGVTYSAVGARYSYTFASQLLLKGASVQDQVAAEAALFYSSISGFRSFSDSTSVVPVIGTARYEVLFGDYYSAFVYSGLERTFSGEEVLSRTRIAAGFGGMLRLGYNWSVRAQFGSDVFGIGAVFKL